MPRVSLQNPPSLGVRQGLSRPHSKGNGTIVGPAWQPAAGLDLASWIDQGRRLGRHARWSKWWVGDWLIYGNGRWGEKYKRAANVLGYDVKTLANVVYVARRFESSRRREDLSWSHHEAVAGLTVPEQEEWLDRASAARLSVRDIRHEVQRRTRPDRPGRSRSTISNIYGGRPPVAASILTSHLVRDLTAALAFYEALGLQVFWRAADCRSALVGAPGERPRLELVQTNPRQLPAEDNARDRVHMTVWVSDVNHALERLGSVTVERQVDDAPDGASLVRDPDGYLVKLVDASTWRAVVDGLGTSEVERELAAVAI